MTKFNILVSETARSKFHELDIASSKKIREGLKELETNPFFNRSKADIKKLKGSRNPILFRLRVGDFRIIYSVEEHKVKVTRIIRRSEGYNWLN